MIALKVCDDKDINVSDTEFRNKVIDSVSDYVRKNFDSVVTGKCVKSPLLEVWDG